jgi:hypothetical protein
VHPSGDWKVLPLFFPAVHVQLAGEALSHCKATTAAVQLVPLQQEAVHPLVPPPPMQVPPPSTIIPLVHWVAEEAATVLNAVWNFIPAALAAGLWHCASQVDPDPHTLFPFWVMHAKHAVAAVSSSGVSAANPASQAPTQAFWVPAGSASVHVLGSRQARRSVQ